MRTPKQESLRANVSASDILRRAAAVSERNEFMDFVYILLSVLVLAFIIFFHELGHFTMGKLLGFRVLGFSIGFGPALIKLKKGGTTYAVRAIPFGGACQFDGEDEAAETVEKEAENPALGTEKFGDTAENAPELSKTEPADEAPKIQEGRRFNAQPVWKRFLVIFAGPFMNILLAFLIAFVIQLVTREYIYTIDAATGDYIPLINAVAEGSPAEAAGVKAGDTVLYVNGQPVLKKDGEDSVNAMVRLISGSGSNITLTVKREEKTLECNIKNAYDPETNTSKIGVTIGRLYEGERRRNVLEAAAGAFDYLVFIVKATGEGIGNMFKHGIHRGDVAGVVGTVAVMVDVAKASVSNLAVIAVILSLSLGIFNLIPFPALDGGRLLFLIIEGIKGKPLNRKAESIANAVGLILLFGLMIVVTVFDVIGLFK